MWAGVVRVLIACEYSQIVTKAFRDRGHEAYSCDILPTEGNPSYHLQGNVLHHLQGIVSNDELTPWDLMIAHPPCTYLANSGVRWLYEKTGRMFDMVDGARFFTRLLEAPVPRICVENPIPHKHACLPKYDQIVQPWMFGGNESKATCLWLRNLPPLVPMVTEKPDKLEQRVWRMPSGS